MILIRHVLIHDWVQSGTSPYDILIENGRIIQISSHVQHEQAREINAKGLWAMPGIVDAHVHLRQPGYEYKETVETGTKAAVAGGVTALCAMPNLLPCPDSPEHLEHVRSFQQHAGIKIIQSCAINKNLHQEKTDWEGLQRMGGFFFTNDGYSIDSMSDLAGILSFSRNHKIVVADHPEVSGMDEHQNQAESVAVLRDLFLNEKIGGHLHLQHVSLSQSVKWMELAKQRQIPFSAETCPHYLMPVEQSTYPGADAVYPPLRNSEDRQAILWALTSGLIDMIVSDHAPHSFEDKAADVPARGFSGIELLFPLCFDDLVRAQIIPLKKLIALLSQHPSRLLGLEPLPIAEGKHADLVLFDPEERWRVEPSILHSQGKNTPFLGKYLKGRVKVTIASGKVVFPFQEDL